MTNFGFGHLFTRNTFTLVRFAMTYIEEYVFTAAQQLRTSGSISTWVVVKSFYPSVGASPDSWVRCRVRVCKGRVRVRVNRALVRVHKVWVLSPQGTSPSPSPVGLSPSPENVGLSPDSSLDSKSSPYFCYFIIFLSDLPLKFSET